MHRHVVTNEKEVPEIKITRPKREPHSRRQQISSSALIKRLYTAEDVYDDPYLS